MGAPDDQGTIVVRQRIAANRAEAMAVAADLARLPEWASGFATAARPDPDDADVWLVDAPFGTVRARFAIDVERGILDHDVTMPDGEVVHNRLRIEAGGDESEAVFTLVRRPGMTDDELAADEAAVRADLSRLAALCARMER